MNPSPFNKANEIPHNQIDKKMLEAFQKKKSLV